MSVRTSRLRLYLILVLMAGCSGSSDAPGDFSSLMKSLSGKKNPELVELLKPYTENVEIPRNSEDAIDRAFSEFSNTAFVKALETSGKAYLLFRDDLSPDELDSLLVLMSVSAAGAFEALLSEAISNELISHRIQEGKPKEELVYFLASLSASYILQGKSEKFNKIDIFLSSSTVEPELIESDFYSALLVYGELLSNYGRHGQAVQFASDLVSVKKNNRRSNSVISQAYSLLLQVALRASKDQLADRVALEMKPYLPDLLDFGVAQQLGNYYMYRGRLEDADEILRRGCWNEKCFGTENYWTHNANLVRVNVMLGRSELAELLYKNSLSSVANMNLVTEESCESWMKAIRTGGAGLENPAMVRVYADMFTWEEERRKMMSPGCVREYFNNIHYGAIRVGNYEDAKENAFKAKDTFFKYAEVGIHSGEYNSWSSVVLEMFFELKMYKEMALIANQARQELLRQGDMYNALNMHVRTIIGLSVIGKEDQAKLLEREGRVVYRDLARDNERAASLLEMAAVVINDEVNSEDLYTKLDAIAGYSMLENQDKIGIDSEITLQFTIQRHLADGEVSQAIEVLKGLIQSRENFSPQRQILAKYYKWLSELLLFNSEIDKAIDAIDKAFLVADKPNNEFSIYRQDMPLTHWADNQSVFLQYLRTSVAYPKRFSDLNRSFLASQKYRENALVRRIKRRSARAQVEQLASQGGSETISIIREYETLFYQIEEQLEESERHTEAERATLFTSFEKKEKLEDDIREAYPSYFDSYFDQPPTIQEVQNLLDNSEALILFISPTGFNVDRPETSALFSELLILARKKFSEGELDDYQQKTLMTSGAFIWLITKNQAMVRRIPSALGQLEWYVNAVRKSVDIDPLKSNSIKDLPRFDIESAAYLYKALFGPIEDRLENIDKLIVIPDGPLNKLPFEALITGNQQSLNADGGDYRGNSWLIQKYAIEVLPSVELFRMLRNNQGKEVFVEPFVGFGDPVLDVGERETTGDNNSDTKPVKYDLPAIPETRETLRQIAKYTGGSPDSVFVGTDATESNVKTLDLTQYQTMAFATHGLLAGELEGIDEPALVLSRPEEETELDDGILQASEVATLNIASQLVLLTACNTGSGNELQVRTGLPSLASAFLYAGARSLIVSHWSAETTSAMKITNQLIEEMAADPRQGPARALQKVKKNFIDSNAEQWSSHPMFWAAFFVVGAN